MGPYSDLASCEAVQKAIYEGKAHVYENSASSMTSGKCVQVTIPVRNQINIDGKLGQ
jgi:hypothetical protein